MRVAHLSYSAAGGAGTVAGTLNSSLVKKGVDSRFFHLSRTNLIDRPLENPKTTILASLDEYLLKRKNFPNQVSVLRNHFIETPNLNQLNSQILNLHWIPGYFDVSSISSNANNLSGVIWTLHDLWPITGGCHYSNQCTAFKEQCSSCPACRKPFRGLIKNEQNKKRQALEKLEKKFTFVAPSHWIANLARESTIGKNLRIEVIPNPVENMYLEVNAKTEARRSLGISEKTLLVAFAAANITDKRKNLNLLLQALDLTKKVHRDLDVQLLLIGRGAKLDQQKFSVVQTGYLGADNLAKTLVGADVFVNLSREENLSIAAIEAMALSIPVIALNSGGNPDLVEHGVSGYLVNGASDLSERLNDLAKCHDLRSSLSRQAQIRYETQFSAARVANEYLKLYESFIG